MKQKDNLSFVLIHPHLQRSIEISDFRSAGKLLETKQGTSMSSRRGDMSSSEHLRDHCTDVLPNDFERVIGRVISSLPQDVYILMPRTYEYYLTW